MNNWLYEGESITHIDDFPPNAYGFIYKITYNGKSYIGKKNLYSNRNVKLGKKELALLKEERKQQGKRGKTPTKKLITKESDWVKYYSSNPILKEAAKLYSNDMVREILHICYNKKELTYFETKYQFQYGVLENPNKFYNDNILGKFFTKDFGYLN